MKHKWYKTKELITIFCIWRHHVTKMKFLLAFNSRILNTCRRFKHFVFKLNSLKMIIIIYKY